jgi:hypothetical protein
MARISVIKKPPSAWGSIFFRALLVFGKIPIQMRLFGFDLRRQAECDQAGFPIFHILINQYRQLLSLAKVP